MQRTGALIERLQQQYRQNVSSEELAVTVQFLLAELQNNRQTDTRKSNVSVIMPDVQAVVQTGISSNIPDDFVPVINQPSVKEEKSAEKQHADTDGKVTASRQPAEPQIKLFLEETKDYTPDEEEEEPEIVEKYVPAEKKEEQIPVEETAKEEAKPKEEKTTQAISVTPPKKENTIFNIPTFALKQQELNEKNAAATQQSLHDKYKAGNNDNAARNEPIKDLRKAIGINDRYRFINELFRNDETMYERSIKTINTFSVLSEAEYWISRELKLKIGWSDDNETVKDFDQLVRRRFS